MKKIVVCSGLLLGALSGTMLGMKKITLADLGINSAENQAHEVEKIDQTSPAPLSISVQELFKMASQSVATKSITVQELFQGANNSQHVAPHYGFAMKKVASSKSPYCYAFAPMSKNEHDMRSGYQNQEFIAAKLHAIAQEKDSSAKKSQYEQLKNLCANNEVCQKALDEIADKGHYNARFVQSMLMVEKINQHDNYNELEKAMHDLLKKTFEIRQVNDKSALKVLEAFEYSGAADLFEEITGQYDFLHWQIDYINFIASFLPEKDTQGVMPCIKGLTEIQKKALDRCVSFYQKARFDQYGQNRLIAIQDHQMKVFALKALVELQENPKEAFEYLSKIEVLNIPENSSLYKDYLDYHYLLVSLYKYAMDCKDVKEVLQLTMGVFIDWNQKIKTEIGSYKLPIICYQHAGSSFLDDESMREHACIEYEKMIKYQPENPTKKEKTGIILAYRILALAYWEDDKADKVIQYTEPILKYANIKELANLGCAYFDTAYNSSDKTEQDTIYKKAESTCQAVISTAKGNKLDDYEQLNLARSYWLLARMAHLGLGQKIDQEKSLDYMKKLLSVEAVDDNALADLLDYYADRTFIALVCCKAENAFKKQLTSATDLDWCYVVGRFRGLIPDSVQISVSPLYFVHAQKHKHKLTLDYLNKENRMSVFKEDVKKFLKEKGL